MRGPRKRGAFLILSQKQTNMEEQAEQIPTTLWPHKPKKDFVSNMNTLKGMDKAEWERIRKVHGVKGSDKYFISPAYKADHAELVAEVEGITKGKIETFKVDLQFWKDTYKDEVDAYNKRIVPAKKSKKRAVPEPVFHGHCCCTCPFKEDAEVEEKPKRKRAKKAAPEPEKKKRAPKKEEPKRKPRAKKEEEKPKKKQPARKVAAERKPAPKKKKQVVVESSSEDDEEEEEDELPVAPVPKKKAPAPVEDVVMDEDDDIFGVLEESDVEEQ